MSNKNTSLKNPKKFATFAALFFCVSIWFSSFAFAQTLTVTSALGDNSAGTLRNIISTATAGSTIIFDLPPGTNVITLPSHITITRNLKIDGGSGVIISGGNSSRIFYISNASLEIKNLTLENGNVGASGGAVHVMGSSGNTSFTAINCTFKNNSAGYGGAVEVFGSSVNASFTAINCTFKNNSAGYGGAVEVDASNNGNATVYLFHCTFDGNTASNPNQGNGIRIRRAGATLYSYNSIFTGSNNQIVTGIGGTNYASASNNLTQGVNGLTRDAVFAGDDLVCDGIVETAKVLKKGDIIHPDAANMIALLKRDQAGKKRPTSGAVTYGAIEGCMASPPFKGNIIVRGGATLIIGKP